MPIALNHFSFCVFKTPYRTKTFTEYTWEAFDGKRPCRYQQLMELISHRSLVVYLFFQHKHCRSAFPCLWKVSHAKSRSHYFPTTLRTYSSQDQTNMPTFGDIWFDVCLLSWRSCSCLLPTSWFHVTKVRLSTIVCAWRSVAPKLHVPTRQFLWVVV